IWVGTLNGIAQLKDGKLTAYKTGDTDTSNTSAAIAGNQRGGLWVGTYDGLKEFRDGRVIKTYGTREGLPSDRISALFEDRAGNLWIGNGDTQDGFLARFTNGKFTFFTQKNGLLTDHIRSITEDHQGNLWFASSLGVTELANGAFINYPFEKDASGKHRSATCVYEDADHDLWIGSFGSGLFRLRAGKLTSFRMKDGLFDDIVWSILEDNRGYLWMTSNRGLSRVLKSDLNDFAGHKKDTIPHVVYGTKDGLLDSEFNGNMQRMGWKTGDGKLLFASTKGMVEVDAEHFQANAPPPPIVIESVLVNDKPV